MERFNNILLYANSKSDNKTALKYASTLAKSNGAKLKIVDVIKEASHYPPILPSINNLNLQDILHDERRRELDLLSFSHKKNGLDISIKVLSGIPFIEVIREIINKEHDLLITTPGAPEGLSEMLFGTTAMQFMRKCPCPVWAIKPSKRDSYNNILAAIDFNDEGESDPLLNDKIMELATSMALKEKSGLHIVHAWDMHHENMLRHHGHLPDKEIEKVVSRIREYSNSRLEKLVKKYASVIRPKNIHLLKGKPEEIIPDIAVEENIDLIVMGTLSRTGIPGFFIGNTAEKILQRVNCSVMSVKPDGFLSPVTAE